LNSTGGIEIINSAYSATIFSLSDAGALNAASSISVGGKKAVNGPAFRAYVDGGQTIVQGAQRKVTFGSETFDTDGCFASSKFTPNIEGYYQLNATVRISGTSGTGEVMLILYKNGTEYARGTNESGVEQGNNFYSMQVSDIAYANGTTDNFEIYIQQSSGADRTTTAGSTISYFSGIMVRGA
jgi:alpha-tubulin suppressor-like RCC1 family protein